MRPVLAAFAALLALAIAPRAQADRNALWRIIDQRCVPHEEHYATPLPCLAVHLNAGYVVLKDRVGIGQLLVVPTARVTGIEDGAVLAPDAPNYFQFAWGVRNLVRALVNSDLPDNALSLAVNSVYGRTQDQLHIHVDCLRPAVRAALLAHAAELSPRWARFPVPLQGHAWLARTVATLNRPGATPFDLVAAGIPGARAHMGRMTLLVTSYTDAAGNPGFVLLADEAHPPADRGSAEELQDHACALARAH